MKDPVKNAGSTCWCGWCTWGKAGMRSRDYTLGGVWKLLWGGEVADGHPSPSCIFTLQPPSFCSQWRNLCGVLTPTFLLSTLWTSLCEPSGSCLLWGLGHLALSPAFSPVAVNLLPKAWWKTVGGKIIKLFEMVWKVTFWDSKLYVSQGLSGYNKIISLAFQHFFPSKGIMSTLVNIVLIWKVKVLIWNLNNFLHTFV